MQLIRDIFLNLDDSLKSVIAEYGVWTYAILFLVIFAETGLVVTPFLPGDSLLFAAGLFAGDGTLNPVWLFVLLTAAAILGDAVNYSIGKMIGPRVLKNENSRIFKKEYLAKTHGFYEKYGGKTIIIARFVPIVRTFAPFVAGVGTMTYARFFVYNVIGAVMWVAACLFAGYFLGKYPLVRDNFEIAVLLIVFVSVLPMVIEFMKARAEKKRAPSCGTGVPPVDENDVARPPSAVESR